MSAHRIILASLPSFCQKIIKIGGNLTKFWQKQFCTVFLDTVYRRAWMCTEIKRATDAARAICIVCAYDFVSVAMCYRALCFWSSVLRVWIYWQLLDWTCVFSTFCRRVCSGLLVEYLPLDRLRLRCPTLPSTRQHLSYDDYLEVKREYYQNCSVLDCVTQCWQSAAHLCEQFLQVQVIGFVTLGPLRCA